MAWFRGTIEIERAPFALSALLPHTERQPLYYNTFVYQVWSVEAVCVASISTPNIDICQFLIGFKLITK